MTLIPSTAASAVYHDALTTARFWRNLCFLVLFLAIAGQLALFFTARFTDYVPVEGAKPGEMSIQPSTPAEPATQPQDEADETPVEDLVEKAMPSTDQELRHWIHAALYATMWGALIFSILMSLTLLFTTLVMLNGRTVGVAKEVSAFFWSLVLILLLVPWQWILNHPTIAGGPFHLPGVLYTWPELNERARFDASDIMEWARFVIWPVFALLVLLTVQGRARRGVKEALGEDLAMIEEPLRDRPLA